MYSFILVIGLILLLVFLTNTLVKNNYKKEKFSLLDVDEMMFKKRDNETIYDFTRV